MSPMDIAVIGRDQKVIPALYIDQGRMPKAPAPPLQGALCGWNRDITRRTKNSDLRRGYDREKDLGAI